MDTNFKPPFRILLISNHFFRTLLIHGLESDWIEEEMADDDDFRFSLFPHSRCTDPSSLNYSCRKDVLEQKLKKVTDDIGYKCNTRYKVIGKTLKLTFLQLLPSRTYFVGKRDRSTTL